MVNKIIKQDAILHHKTDYQSPKLQKDIINRDKGLELDSLGHGSPLKKESK